MSAELDPALAERVERARRRFRARLGGSPAVVAWGPGRVNLIGEHTDYNQGLAMPAAIDRWVVVALRPRRDRRVQLWSEAFGESLSLRWGEPFAPTASWQRFVVGAMAVLDGPADIPHGWEGVLLGDVPLGAGLSSSAAVEVALLNALRALYEVQLEDLELIRLCQRIEHEHLGLHSGLLDQFASQFSRPGHLLVVDFDDLSHRHVPARLNGWTWVVLDSGVRRELAGSAYQQRVAECAEGLAWVRARHPAVRRFRDLSVDHLPEGPVWARRLRHVIDENARVLATERALVRGDLDRVGELLIGSHRSLRDLYQVSCTELDVLVEEALAWTGCAGARMVGGGFGGCTLNLVRDDRVAGLVEAVGSAYQERTGWSTRGWRFRFVGGGGASRP